MPAFEPPPSAFEVVLTELRRAITDGTFLPGSRIQPDVVAAGLGVSRAPVREAMRVLEAEGQLVHAARLGYTVPELDGDGLAEVLQMRAMLEPDAVRAGLAAGGDHDRLAALRAALADLGAATDPRAAYEAERRFHFALFDPGARPRLLRAMHRLWDWYAPYLVQCPAGGPDLGRLGEVVDAVRHGRVDAVLEMLAEERATSRARLTAALVDRRPEPSGRGGTNS